MIGSESLDEMISIDIGGEIYSVACLLEMTDEEFDDFITIFQGYIRNSSSEISNSNLP